MLGGYFSVIVETKFVIEWLRLEMVKLLTVVAKKNKKINI